jgi:hypothetical protein
MTPSEKIAEKLFDVIAVNIKTLAERIMETRLTKLDAEAFVKIAVFRRGVEEEFYKTEPHPYTPKAAP